MPTRTTITVSLISFLLTSASSQPYQFDLVVYGGTAGGVITAVAAAREGALVALLEPRDHLGGMVSGGLGRTDYGKKDTIGGISLEFFKRVGRHYGSDVGWFFEPHVAENVFNEMAREAGIKIFHRHRLREKNGVRNQRGQIVEILMENGATFRAPIFADCTYEGDLMAQARVSYTWGREAVAQYSESLAGVRERTPFHQFTVRISPFNEQQKLLPEVYAGPRGTAGEADRKVQAYNFRMCLTDQKDNQLPYPKPKNYSPGRFELLARLLKAFTDKNGRAPHMNEIMSPLPIPNHKTDVNNNGAFSTDYIGKNWEYPKASYARRGEIWQDHMDYVAGFFYFLAHDARVPAALQDEVNRWGLAKDEFLDTDHWPHQLYVREARRMVGTYIMTQKDIQSHLTKEDVIGMGSYNSDSHNVQRVPTSDGAVENEGDMQVPVTPYQIPYRILLPKRQQATNLLVPVCVSASHVAYSTLRMEPVYMIMGHAAGVAAKMAIDGKTALHDVDTRELTEKLRAQGAIMEWVAGSIKTENPPPRKTMKPRGTLGTRGTRRSVDTAKIL
ncbi:MAG TPA: FAD-dependent oxidoreductase [Acidobacteriota bacterium]